MQEGNAQPSEDLKKTPNKKDGPTEKPPKKKSEKSPKKAEEKLETPRRENEAKPVAVEDLVVAAKKIQETRGAKNESKEVKLSYKERRSLQKVVEAAGFVPEELFELDNAQLLFLTQQVLAGKVEGAEAVLLHTSDGQISKLDKLNIEKAQDADEEQMDLFSIRSRLKDDRNTGVMGGGTFISEMPGMPRVTAITNPGLKPFVKEIETMLDALPGVRVSEGELIEQLQQIEAELRKAIFEGRLTADSEVDLVRNALREGVNFKLIEYRKEQFNFDANFDEEYKRTKSEMETIATDPVARATAIRNLDGIVRAAEDVVDIVGRWHPGDPPVVFTRDRNYRMLFEIVRALKQDMGRYPEIRHELRRANPGLLSRIEAFTTPVLQENSLEMVNRYFFNLFSNLSDEERQEKTGDIQEAAGLAHTTIVSGLRGREEMLANLFKLTYSRQESSGIREWKGLTQIVGVENSVKFDQVFKAPGDWKDTPEKMNEMMAAVEQTGLSGQDLQGYINRMFQAIDIIPRTLTEGNAMYSEIRKQIEAFKFKQILFITAHQKMLNPEDMNHVFAQEMEGVKHETFEEMFKRFAHDVRGREFYALKFDRNTGRVIAGDKEKINLFDVSNSLYSHRLRDERIKMNMVEEMTRYSIANEFNAAQIRQMKIDCGLLDADGNPVSVFPWSEAKWEAELENIRKYLKREFEHEIAAARQKRADGKPMTEDDLAVENFTIADWAQDHSIKGNNTIHGGRAATREAIDHWYTKNTLHGAYGILEETVMRNGRSVPNPDIADVINPEFIELFRKRNPDGTPAESVTVTTERLHRDYVGKHLMDIRRAEMRQRLIVELRRRGLSYDENVHLGHEELIDPVTGRPLPPRLETADLDQMFRTGYLSSVDSNAADMAWIFQWSQYNCIRIYGRGQRDYRDDFRGVVVNHSSDIYNGLIVDHNWEYLHEDFEKRGRHEVNRFFRQYFPGKHHWLFGHVSMGVAFVKPFLTDANKVELRNRTRAFIAENNFTNPDPEHNEDFEDYAEKVMLRDMVEQGIVSFGDSEFTKKVEGDPNSFTKFNLLDNADDRKRLQNMMTAGQFQDFSGNPEYDKFMELTDKEKNFPSTRGARLMPWMHFGAKAFWELAHNNKYRLYKEPDLTRDKMENFVHRLIGSNRMERKQGEKFINEELGKGMLRGIKNVWEHSKENAQLDRAGPKWGRTKGWALFFLFLIFSPIKELFKSTFEETKKQ